MSNLTSLVNQLQKERSRLASQLKRLSNALSVLSGVSTRRGRTISAARRARMAAAQRARWAKVRGQKVIPMTTRKRRKLSATALAHIRAAQRTRWAEWRKAQKAG